MSTLEAFIAGAFVTLIGWSIYNLIISSLAARALKRKVEEQSFYDHKRLLVELRNDHRVLKDIVFKQFPEMEKIFDNRTFGTRN